LDFLQVGDFLLELFQSAIEILQLSLDVDSVFQVVFHCVLPFLQIIDVGIVEYVTAAYRTDE
jgi:hypothetical protein